MSGTVALTLAAALLAPACGAALLEPACRPRAPTPQLTATADDAALDFPEPLTERQRIARAADFGFRVLPVIGSYLSLYTQLGLKEKIFNQCLSDEECEVVWDEQHERGSAVLSDAINDLKGFYTKTGQIIASRQDLFPKQYIDALAGLTDFTDPMPASLVRAVVERELLADGRAWSDVFAEFDDAPLGAASVAQVHRAVLSEAYGGREVAVKVQRPAIEPKLLGDVANLKNLARYFRGMEAVPVDYYVVFSELEAQLGDEFDFVKEADAMERIGKALRTDPDGLPCEPPLVTPLPVAGLVTRRVLVMDFLRGEPLSRAVDKMEERGIDPNGPEARLFGRRLLGALTTAFGRTILESGFFHADPHPGNLFVLDDGRLGLIDFGQVKQISVRSQRTLGKVMMALADRTSDTDPAELAKISELALELGVELKEGSPPEGPAAVAMWLFDGALDSLPGGFDVGELSPNSPVKVLKSFPQECVLVGRSTVLIKGIAARLGIRWSLANEWAPIAKRAQARDSKLRAVLARLLLPARWVGWKLAAAAGAVMARLPDDGWGRKARRGVARLAAPRAK